MLIKIEDIKTEAGTQTRAMISEQVVGEYAEAMEDGAVFPPVVVFHDGTTYWMADGFHRIMAAARNSFTDIEAEIRKGTRQDALIYALGANVTNGLRRTNADKCHCVQIALKEFADWSDRRVAEACGVSQPFVSKLRPQVITVITSAPTTRIGRDGKQYPVSDPTEAKIVQIEKIRELSAQGFRSEQIAEQVSVSPKRIRVIARESNIDLPDFKMGRQRKIDVNRIVSTTAEQAEALMLGLDLVGSRLDDLDLEKVGGWIESIESGIKGLQGLVLTLRQAQNPDYTPVESKKSHEATGPCVAMLHADNTIMQLEKIPPNDIERTAALERVLAWVTAKMKEADEKASSRQRGQRRAR